MIFYDIISIVGPAPYYFFSYSNQKLKNHNFTHHKQSFCPEMKNYILQIQNLKINKNVFLNYSHFSFKKQFAFIWLVLFELLYPCLLLVQKHCCSVNVFCTLGSKHLFRFVKIFTLDKNTFLIISILIFGWWGKNILFNLQGKYGDPSLGRWG